MDLQSRVEKVRRITLSRAVLLTALAALSALFLRIALFKYQEKNIWGGFYEHLLTAEVRVEFEGMGIQKIFRVPQGAEVRDILILLEMDDIHSLVPITTKIRRDSNLIVTHDRILKMKSISPKRLSQRTSTRKKQATKLKNIKMVVEQKELI